VTDPTPDPLANLDVAALTADQRQVLRDVLLPYFAADQLGYREMPEEHWDLLGRLEDAVLADRGVDARRYWLAVRDLEASVAAHTDSPEVRRLAELHSLEALAKARRASGDPKGGPFSC
jgi:hypothetical protein